MSNQNKFFILAILIFFILTPGVYALDLDYGETFVDVDQKEIYMVRGEQTTIDVQSLTRASTTHPNIIDIVNADETKVLLSAKGVGQATLFIWEKEKKRAIKVFVVNQDLSELQDRVEQLLKSAKIEGIAVQINEREGKVVLSGEVPEYKEKNFEQITEVFDDDIINLVETEERTEMIRLDGQVTELSTTLSKSLGINWFSGGSGLDLENTSGGGLLNPSYSESLPDFDGSISDFFKIGDFRRTSTLVAQVNLLLEEGRGEILSQPSLVVESGEEASFLVGGEVPIRTSTVNESGSTENVTFKEFGIALVATPTIKKDEKIEILLNVEVSDTDDSKDFGNDVAFITRSASTQLYLDDGQPIVLAGLIRHKEGENIEKVPFLSDIPVLGILFRKRKTPTANEDSEMVISITPHILRKENNYLQKKEAAKKEPAPAKGSLKGSPRGEYNIAAVVPENQKILERRPPSYFGIPQEMEPYIHMIQKKIAHAIEYPREAKDYGWEGTIKVGALVLSDGTLAMAAIKESSGYEIFDEYALNTVKNSAPYSKFPTDATLQELNITIPIVYSLKNK